MHTWILDTCIHAYLHICILAYLMKILQTLQNRAARLESNKDRFTPVRDLLISCGWLSQLVAFHRVLLLFNIKQKRKPRYFAEKFVMNKNPRTRFQCDGRLKKQMIYKKDESRNSFVPDSIDVRNCLPVEMGKLDDSRLLKPKLRT